MRVIHYTLRATKRQMPRRAFTLTSAPPYCIIKTAEICRRGGIGRRQGLKIPCWKQRAGSNPAGGIGKGSGGPPGPPASFFELMMKSILIYAKHQFAKN
jgi:hypothetical protein